MKYILFYIIIFSSHVTFSQWQNDIRLTNDTHSSQTKKRCIQASENYVHAVWSDDRDGNAEIYYKRSTDIGVSWSQDIRLTNNSALSTLPELTISGPYLFVIWHDERNGNYQVYYKRSSDFGYNWSEDMRLSNTFAWSFVPSIHADGPNICAVWQDGRDTLYEIYFRGSTDYGQSWSAEKRLTYSPNAAQYPVVSVNQQNVFVAWQDYLPLNEEIYFTRSTNNGINWVTETRITNNSFSSFSPDIFTSNNRVHIVWCEYRSNNYVSFYKSSTNNGLSWGSDNFLTNSSYSSQSPSLSVAYSLIHIVWSDNRDGNYEIYYKKLSNYGAVFGPDIRLTNDPSYSGYPSISFYGAVLHILWEDNRDGNNEIYYKKNPTGNILKLNNNTNSAPRIYSLSQNYPNPFNPVTNIEFNIPNAGFVKLTVYDMLGREITQLINRQMQPGSYNFDWDASSYPSGVYFYKLESGNFSESKKMVLIK